MCFGFETNDGGTLLHGLQGVFDLVKPALRREDGIVRIVRISELFETCISASVHSIPDITDHIDVM